MTEQRRKLVVYGVLVAAVCYGGYSFWGSKPAAPPLPPTIQALDSVAAPGAVVADSTIDRLRTLPWGYDPFRTVGVTQSEGSSIKQKSSAMGPLYVLTGILQHPTHPLAYINGKMAGVGEVVDGARVVKIENEKVILDIHGERRTLILAKG